MTLKKKKRHILKDQAQVERKKFQTPLIFDLLVHRAEHFFGLKLI